MIGADAINDFFRKKKHIHLYENNYYYKLGYDKGIKIRHIEWIKGLWTGFIITLITFLVANF